MSVWFQTSHCIPKELTYHRACIEIEERQKRDECCEHGVQDDAVDLVVPLVSPKNKKSFVF